MVEEHMVFPSKSGAQESALAEAPKVLHKPKSASQSALEQQALPPAAVIVLLLYAGYC